MNPKVQIKPNYSCAIVITPKETFLEWANILDEEERYTRDDIQPSVYLFPEYQSAEDALEALPNIYDKMFLGELHGWTNDEVLLPRGRTFAMFNEWFLVEITVNVFRIVEEGANFELTEDQRNYWPAKQFHDRMLSYLEEYKDFLLLEKGDGTLASHGDIVHQFINFLFSNLVTEFGQITVAMVRSRFYGEFKKMNEQFISKEDLQKILKGFFEFLEKKHGVKNERVIRGLAK